MLKMWISDLDSPSYFVATAAVQLGLFKDEGIDVELVHETADGSQQLRDGTVSFIAGSSWSATPAFPAWKGLKILCALGQYAYWFLAVRADLNVRKGDLQAIKGLRISASKGFPGLVLRHMLREAGLELKRDNITLVPKPPVASNSARGRSGVDAIEQGHADAFWGNGMRVAMAESLGIAKTHIDLRRGDGPPGARRYNFPALTTTARLVQERPDVAAGAVRAIVKTQKALRADPSLATKVGEALFPAHEASLIAKLVERDAPFYDAAVSPETIEGLSRLGLDEKLFSEPLVYDEVVATRYKALWEG